MKVLLVYNPRSGNRSFAENLDLIVEKFQKRDFELLLHRVDTTEKLEELFGKTKEDVSSFSRILVAGGDGTVNQVVHFMLKYEIDLPLGIYPVGTCNDYAKLFPFEKSIAAHTETLMGDYFVLSDVGQANDSYFINVASFGVFVDSGQRTDDVAKNLLGPFAYYLKAAEEFINLEAVTISIESEQLSFDGDAFFVLIMNGKSAGGFNKLGCLASINDGLLDVLIFKKCPVLELPTVLLEVMAGNHHLNKNVISFKTNYMKVYCNSSVGTDIDGEKGPSFPLEIKVIPNKLKIISKEVKPSSRVGNKRRKNG